MSAGGEGGPGRSPEPPAGTQAVQRALALLDLLMAGPSSLSDLSRRAGLARPTTHRLLGALESWRLVERRGTDYAPGPGLQEKAALTSLVRPGSWPQASPIFPRMVAGNQDLAWRDWAGQAHPAMWEPTHDLEYWAVRNAAGLIDVSSLYIYELRGSQAALAAQRLFTRDVGRCRVGQVLYGCWCDDDGHVLQDGNLWRLEAQRFRLSSADPCLRWLQSVAAPFDCEVAELTGELAVLALQGPRARAVLCEFLCDGASDGAAPDAASAAASRRVERLSYFRAAEVEGPLGSIEVSRTGFTGDLGYELWLPREAALGTWDRLLDVGTRHKLRPVGLAALDALRIEAGLILLEVDYVSSARALTSRRLSTPFDLGLDWAVKFVDGNDFVGREALERRAAEGADWLFCGVQIPWSSLDAAYRRHGLRPLSVGGLPCRQARPLWSGPNQVGQITSQVFSPLLKAQIALGSVRRSEVGIDPGAGSDAWAGTVVEVDLDIEMERVRVAAELVPLPFYDPPHKRARARRPAGSHQREPEA